MGRRDARTTEAETAAFIESTDESLKISEPPSTLILHEPNIPFMPSLGFGGREIS